MRPPRLWLAGGVIAAALTLDGAVQANWMPKIAAEAQASPAGISETGPPPKEELPTPTDDEPSPPTGVMDNHRLTGYAGSPANVSGKDSWLETPKKRPQPQIPKGGQSEGTTDGPVKVKNPPKDKKVEVNTHTCNNGIRQCQAAQQACTTAGGGHVTAPAQVTWISVDDGPWQYATISCGPPTSIEIPETSEGGAVEVELEAPPVPTLGQIQREFRSLPFAKPGVKIQPKGQRTAKNLKTFYAADWPDDDGLGPGDVSEPIKLLSWTIEFKVAAQDYRYSYGDGKTSGWTASTGGTYPDGDVTHTYSETGDVEVKVDARLTGQYRVNGGQWQDIDTVADLQDEPSFTLQVRGTKTGLVHR